MSKTNVKKPCLSPFQLKEKQRRLPHKTRSTQPQTKPKNNPIYAITALTFHFSHRTICQRADNEFPK